MKRRACPDEYTALEERIQQLTDERDSAEHRASTWERRALRAEAELSRTQSDLAEALSLLGDNP